MFKKWLRCQSSTFAAFDFSWEVQEKLALYKIAMYNANKKLNFRSEIGSNPVNMRVRAYFTSEVESIMRWAAFVKIEFWFLQ